MKPSSCDVTSYNVVWRWVLLQQKGHDRGRLNTLVGSGWATAVLLHMHKQVEKPVLSPCAVPISGGEAVFPVWASGLSAECCDYCKLINGGYGLSHECVEDGCKSTCVKFGAENIQ